MDIKDILGRVQLNARKIDRNLEIIDARKKEFEESVAYYKDHVKMLKMNNDQLLKKNVKFYFKDLLMVIADEWQCKVKDLQVSNKIGSFIMQKASKKEVLRRAISEIVNRNEMLKITIKSPDGKKTFGLSFAIDDKLEKRQVDGIILAEHISIAKNELKSGKLSYVMEYDDLKQLVVIKPLCDLVYLDQESKLVPYNNISRLILRMLIADEKVSEKEKE